MELTRFPEEAQRRWGEALQIRLDSSRSLCELACNIRELPDMCRWLFSDLGYGLAGLIVEEGASAWELRYVFYGEREAGWVHVVVDQTLTEKAFPSISAQVHAADWQERESEDLFGLVFEGHPRLGDFVLHNDRWPENVAPMRKGFDGSQPLAHREPDLNWQPRRIVSAPGAFSLPIGPIYAGVTESVHFLLETVGEDVIRAFPRLFYQYRGIEKIAEGRSIEDALLLAERFAATTAFAHSWAFCQAVERINEIEVPTRARLLRVLLAELERFRHHVGVIEGICESTGLAVAASQAAILEEELLRLSGASAEHRYLFGLNVPGGLTRDLEDSACRKVVETAKGISVQLKQLEKSLRSSSSFLDRLEEVGIVPVQEARNHGLVGPVARASGVGRDLRSAQSYSGYETFKFEIPCEREGDCYARLRILFAEAAESVGIIEQAVAALPDGPIRHRAATSKPGVALGWVEAPRGAAFHWVRLGEGGTIARYRLLTPSFANWHGFHLAAENFAFQDFPIILATFGLSVGENDR